MHLIVDGYGGDPRKLEDEELVRHFLDTYPEAIGMTKMAPPQVYTYHGRHPEDWGVSGFVLIAESHISVHTFPDRGYVNVDMFSCKDFDTAAAVRDMRGLFALERVRDWTLDRGVDHSTPREAYGGMVRERVNLLSSDGPSRG